MPDELSGKKNVSLFCNRVDVKNKVLTMAIAQAQWIDQDVDERILESYNYINSILCKVGYLPADLIQSDFIRNVSIMYSRWAIMRDVYAGYSPSASANDSYPKWKEQVDDWLNKIVNDEMRLLDRGDKIIEKTGTDTQMRITINTKDVKRMITLDDSSNWTMDSSNFDTDVIGEH